MLADRLLEAGRPQDALVEYGESLRVDLNRFNGLYGAARAAEAANQPKMAAEFYAQLLKNCDGPDADRPELARAKSLLAQRYRYCTVTVVTLVPIRCVLRSSTPSSNV